MIKCDMLVVESKERKPCDKVKKKLDRLYNKCRDDISYASGSRPWSMSGSSRPDSSQRPVKLDMSDEAQRKIARNLQVKQIKQAKQVLSRFQGKPTGLTEQQHGGFPAPEFPPN
jgi:hypothetical protein